jgi:Dockerin type I domain
MSARRILRVETLESRTTPSLTPVGPEFQVNVSTTGHQWEPKVACDAAGDFVIVFPGYDASLSTHYGLFGQLYHADGSLNGGQFLVSNVPSYFSTDASVAMNSAGSFVVAWSAVGDINVSDQFVILARQYDSSGVPQGPSFQVNQNATYDCVTPMVAISASGGFAITWEMDVGSNSLPVGTYLVPQTLSAIMLRQFDSGGNAISTETTVADNLPSSLTNLGLENAAVSVDSSGDMAVAWSEKNIDHGWGSKLRFYMASGQTSGEVQFNSNTTPVPITFDSSNNLYATGNNGLLRITASVAPVVSTVFASTGAVLIGIPRNDGSFVGAGQITGIGNAGDVFAQEITPLTTGYLLGSAVQFNTYLPDEQSRPAICVDADGDGVITWRSMGEDGSGFGVYARRFAGNAPVPFAPLVNNGSSNMSSVTSASVSFHRVLTLPSNAFELTGPNGIVPVAVDLSGTTSAGTKITFTFPGQIGGSLPDGNYTLRIKAAMVTDSAGQLLDGNGDGVPGDDYVMSFHRLLGDFNGDGAVGANDFALFRLALGTNNLIYDLDGDGTVDANDFFLFRMQFNTSV